MGIWNKLKEKFSSTTEEDLNDAEFKDIAPSDQPRAVDNERLQWVLDNFSNWPSPRFQYVALIERPDAVVGIKRTLKFYKTEPNEGVEVYTRDFINQYL